MRLSNSKSDTRALREARLIAESIVGSVIWRGAAGSCQCPGAGLHTTRNAQTDCKVVCAPVELGNGILAPGVYCYHESCNAACEAASYKLRRSLCNRSMSLSVGGAFQRSIERRPEPEFNARILAAIAAKLDGIDCEWLSARSPKRVDNRAPASFLHDLYLPGEKVVVFDVFESQGQHLWTHRMPPFNACELDDFRTGKRNGVWFLCQPVTGDYFPNDSGLMSRRSWQNVTSWRYLVLESDRANSSHWLAALAQMPLAISAIYTSGGHSIHALVRLDAESRNEWDSAVLQLKPCLVTLGADAKAMSAVRLTRLPLCERLGSTDKSGVYRAYPVPRLQRLLYLNPCPELTPLCEMEVT